RGAFRYSLIVSRKMAAALLFWERRWKIVGTAVGFSNRCWSSNRLEKLSLVKCSLQRNEYLVGVQLSL
uniref:Uncharacterized protein n=2 Tax=Strigidae TaxID=30459 RepID=A0A8C0IEY1_BUBBB